MGNVKEERVAIHQVFLLHDTFPIIQSGGVGGWGWGELKILTHRNISGENVLSSTTAEEEEEGNKETQAGIKLTTLKEVPPSSPTHPFLCLREVRVRRTN